MGGARVALLALAVVLLAPIPCRAADEHPGAASLVEAGDIVEAPGYWIDFTWFRFDAGLALDLQEAQIQIADLTFQWESEVKIAEPAARHISRLEKRIRQLESVARSPVLNLVIGWIIGGATVALGAVVFTMAAQ